MIGIPSRPLLIRCINLPISRFGDYEQLSVKKNCESPTNSIKLKINDLINNINMEDGILLFNNEYKSFTLWLTFNSQKITKEIGYNIHSNFKLEDLIRGIIINHLPDENYRKDYWAYFNSKYY